MIYTGDKMIIPKGGTSGGMTDDDVVAVLRNRGIFQCLAATENRFMRRDEEEKKAKADVKVKEQMSTGPRMQGAWASFYSDLETQDEMC